MGKNNGETRKTRLPCLIKKGLKAMDINATYRISNECKYDIGVKTTNGLEVNIPAGSNYVRLSVEDIYRIEGMCHKRKVFSAGMLVPVSDDGKKLTLEDLGAHTDSYTVENQKHLSDEEILQNIKKPNKAFEAWVRKIEDLSELESVIAVAKANDISASKLRILQSMVPDRDLLDIDEEQ